MEQQGSQQLPVVVAQGQAVAIPEVMEVEEHRQDWMGQFILEHHQAVQQVKQLLVAVEIVLQILPVDKVLV